MDSRTKTTLTTLIFTALIAIPALATDLDTTAILDIVEGITVTETSALNFGDVALNTGTMTVGTDGAVTDPDFLSFDAATVSQGVFSINAIAGNAYDIVITENVPAVGLILDNFQINIDGGADEAGANSFIGVTLSAATSTLNLGADITVDALTASLGDGQTIGYQVSVNFN